MSFFMLLSSPDSTHFHVARSGESRYFVLSYAPAFSARLVGIDDKATEPGYLLNDAMAFLSRAHEAVCRGFANSLISNISFDKAVIQCKEILNNKGSNFIGEVLEMIANIFELLSDEFESRSAIRLQSLGSLATLGNSGLQDWCKNGGLGCAPVAYKDLLIYLDRLGKEANIIGRENEWGALQSDLRALRGFWRIPNQAKEFWQIPNNIKIRREIRMQNGRKPIVIDRFTC